MAVQVKHLKVVIMVSPTFFFGIDMVDLYEIQRRKIERAISAARLL